MEARRQGQKERSEISDEKFEAMVRAAGCRPTLEWLGWMRWAYEQGKQAQQLGETPEVEVIQARVMANVPLNYISLTLGSIGEALSPCPTKD